MHRVFLLVISKIKSIFQKSLSFSSQIEYSTISRKAKVWGHCKVYHSTIDDYSYIGPHCRVIYTHIGRFCSIAGDSAIGMGTHLLNRISTSSLFTTKKNGTGISWCNKATFEEFKDIHIGNDVWIGNRVMVMGGVNIGNGAVVGAGALVTKDIPPYAIVGGIPAKIIRYRFPEHVISALEKSEWWKLDDDILKNNISLFQNPLENDNLEKLILLSKGYKSC